MNKLKKGDFVEYLVERLEVSKKQAEDITESFIDFVTSTLKKGDEFTLTGFGTFLAKTRKGRVGINPKNPSEKVQIPSSIVPRFRAGKGLKDALN